jgi:hypothetical protein
MYAFVGTTAKSLVPYNGRRRRRSNFAAMPTEAERELTSLIQDALAAPRPSEADQGGKHHTWTE